MVREVRFNLKDFGMTNKKKYWMVCTNHQEIWGVSDKTPSNAFKNAKDLYFEYYKKKYDRNSSIKLWKPIECSKQLYNWMKIQCQPYRLIGRESWTMIQNVAHLNRDINTKENCDAMRGLLNGCYEVVYLWDVSTPGQKAWKENWLKEASKHGAGFDD